MIYKRRVRQNTVNTVVSTSIDCLLLLNDQKKKPCHLMSIVKGGNKQYFNLKNFNRKSEPCK